LQCYRSRTRSTKNPPTFISLRRAAAIQTYQPLLKSLLENVDIEKIVRDVYRSAGYGGPWNPDPGKIRVTTELCEEVLHGDEEQYASQAVYLTCQRLYGCLATSSS
jgi:hypothetical protein